MTRERLPNRRRSENFELRFAGTDLTCVVGFDRLDRPREIFIHSRKIGTMLDTAARDQAILISLLLQHGATPAEIVHSLTTNEEGEHEGLAGLILTRLIEMAGVDG